MKVAAYGLDADNSAGLENLYGIYQLATVKTSGSSLLGHLAATFLF
jgi:hypothetical protein